MATDEKDDMHLQQEEAVQSSSSSSDASPKSEDKLKDEAKVTKKKAKMPVDWDSETYNMNHKRRGKVVIFNHENFDTHLELEPRHGTEVDVKNLTSTLSNFGFEVVVFQDLCISSIHKKIQKTANENHSDADCIMVILLTHGFQGHVFAKDAKYEPDILWEPFASNKCPTLAGKPKIFLIQACRGDQIETGTELVESTQYIDVTSSQKVPEITIPTHADFLVAYATVFGCVSIRDKLTGTWFIGPFCDIMNKFGATDDLLYNMTRVSRSVAEKMAVLEIDKPKRSVRVKQMPCIMTMLTRSVIFTPKNDLDHDNV